jgi:hypothetical protein
MERRHSRTVGYVRLKLRKGAIDLTIETYALRWNPKQPFVSAFEIALESLDSATFGLSTQFLSLALVLALGFLGFDIYGRAVGIETGPPVVSGCIIVFFCFFAVFWHLSSRRELLASEDIKTLKFLLVEAVEESRQGLLGHQNPTVMNTREVVD